jgi:hypothetical protein
LKADFDRQDSRVGWAKALLAPCPRGVFPQTEPLRVGTADRRGAAVEVVAAFAHPTALF